MPLGMAISRQYLIPTGNIKAYNVSVLIGAIISVVINIILLPRIGIYGVVIAWRIFVVIVSGRCSVIFLVNRHIT
ncbi:hypothetical protein ACUODF_52815, partial [Escherichia coli]